MTKKEVSYDHSPWFVSVDYHRALLLLFQTWTLFLPAFIMSRDQFPLYFAPWRISKKSAFSAAPVGENPGICVAAFLEKGNT